MKHTVLIAISIFVFLISASLTRADDRSDCSGENLNILPNIKRIIAACDRLVRSTSGRPRAEAYYWRGFFQDGVARLQGGGTRDENATLADFDAAISTDATYAPPYIGRAQIKLDRRDYDGAIADYTKAIQLDPTGDPYAYKHRGEILQNNLRREREAIPDLLQFVHLTEKSTNSTIKMERGFVLASLKRMGVAEVMTDMEMCDPQTVDGRSSLPVGPFDQRIAACGRIISSDSFSPKEKVSAYLRLFEAYTYSSNPPKYGEALKASEDAMRIDPKNARVYKSRARARVGLKDIEGAIADFTETLRLDPKEFDALYDLGRMHQLAGRKDEAIKNYRAYVDATRGNDSMGAQMGRDRAMRHIRDLSTQ